MIEGGLRRLGVDFVYLEVGLCESNRLFREFVGDLLLRRKSV